MSTIFSWNPYFIHTTHFTNSSSTSTVCFIAFITSIWMFDSSLRSTFSFSSVRVEDPGYRWRATKRTKIWREMPCKYLKLINWNSSIYNLYWIRRSSIVRRFYSFLCLSICHSCQSIDVKIELSLSCSTTLVMMSAVTLVIASVRHRLALCACQS